VPPVLLVKSAAGVINWLLGGPVSWRWLAASSFVINWLHGGPVP
jgi:hypothetical protein